MNFTYESYQGLLQLLRDHNYEIATYHNWEQSKKCVILRHDIDNDIEKSLQLAKVENSCGVKSTYFVLVTSDFYNVFSKQSAEMLREIMSLGHEIGLHFDEVQYPELAGNGEKISEKISQEARLLRCVTGIPVTIVSMHRPSKEILSADLHIPNMINSYGKVFFDDFKYLSDSRRRWREPVEQIIQSEQYERLHILTHAFWYAEQEKSIQKSVSNFVNAGNQKRYLAFADNITDLAAIMKPEEVR